MNGGLLPGEFASFIEPLFRKVVCYASQSLAVLLEKDSSPVLHNLINNFIQLLCLVCDSSVFLIGFYNSYHLA